LTLCRREKRLGAMRGSMNTTTQRNCNRIWWLNSRRHPRLFYLIRKRALSRNCGWSLLRSCKAIRLSWLHYSVSLWKKVVGKPMSKSGKRRRHLTSSTERWWSTWRSSCSTASWLKREWLTITRATF
jgi:hypothetical protein